MVFEILAVVVALNGAEVVDAKASDRVTVDELVASDLPADVVVAAWMLPVGREVRVETPERAFLLCRVS